MGIENISLNSNTRVLSKTGEGPKQFKHACKITEVGDPNSKRVVIALGGIFHRGKNAWGNLPNIVSQEYDARFTSFDWPKDSYDSEIVLAQIENYIKKSQAEEIVLAGLSFGDIVVRDLLDKMSPEMRAKVKGHISYCGVSTSESLNGFDVVNKFKSLIANKVISTIAKPVLGFVGTLDRGHGKYRHKWSSGMVDPTRGIDKHRLEGHIKAASMGLTMGTVDRVVHMLKTGKILHTHLPEDIRSIPVFAVYSDSDPTFKVPIMNAVRISSRSYSGQLLNLEDGGHAALVEQPEKYDEVSRKILDEIFSK